MRLVLAGWLLILAAVASAAENTGTIEIRINGLAGVEGVLYMAAYDSNKTWLGDEVVARKKVVIADAMQGKQVVAQLQEPEAALALQILTLEEAEAEAAAPMVQQTYQEYTSEAEAEQAEIQMKAPVTDKTAEAAAG